MIHPPKQDESQISLQGNPSDSGFRRGALTAEFLVGGGLVGASALVIAGGVAVMRHTREKDQSVDIDEAVRNAPYHRLHNVLSVEGA